MNSKKAICILLCLSLLFSIAACSNVEDAYSSSAHTSSVNSTVTSNDSTSSKEEYQDVEIVESDDASSNNLSSNQQVSSNTSNNSNVSSNNSSSSDNDSSSSDLMDMLYGFSSIKSVNYYCLRNITGSDILYSVSSIITNKDTDIANDTSLTISCDDKNVKIDGTVISIPESYAKNNKSVKFTARHSGVGAKYDFTIKPNVKWNLIFEDNFDGTTINTDVWNIWDEKRDWRYSYSKDNMILDGKGYLYNRMSILETPDAVTGEHQISGAMTTQGKFETTYGYFEVRMKPHKAEGLMGAFWLMCGDMGDKNAADDGTAKNGCEVDIIETFYHRTDPSHTIHWDGYTYTKSFHFNNSGRDDIFDGNFHTFAFRWSPTEYVFFIDGEVSGRTTQVDICEEPGYLLISSHFNTNAGTLPIGVGEYTDMVVDYVRVYSSSDDIK